MSAQRKVVRDKSLWEVFKKNIGPVFFQVVGAVFGVLAVAKLGSSVATIIFDVLALVGFLGTAIFSFCDFCGALKGCREKMQVHNMSLSNGHEALIWTLTVLAFLGSGVLGGLGIFFEYVPISSLVASAFVAAAPLVLGGTVGFATSYLQTKAKIYQDLTAPRGSSVPPPSNQQTPGYPLPTVSVAPSNSMPTGLSPLETLTGTGVTVHR